MGEKNERIVGWILKRSKYSHNSCESTGVAIVLLTVVLFFISISLLDNRLSIYLITVPIYTGFYGVFDTRGMLRFLLVVGMIVNIISLIVLGIIGLGESNNPIPFSNIFFIVDEGILALVFILVLYSSSLPTFVLLYGWVSSEYSGSPLHSDKYR